MAGEAEPVQTSDAASAEALALQRGLQLVHRLGCSKWIIESDCMEIIEACNGVTEVRSAPYSAIMADCFQLAHEISDLRFVFCPRDVAWHIQ